MAIKYVLVERPNPQDRNAPKKFYANAVVRGSMGLEGLAERIAGSSTASKGDIMLVLTALGEQLQQLMMEGYSVKVDGLGTFRVTINGIGSDTPEEFSSSLIRKFSIRYRPEVDLMAKVNRSPLERTTIKCSHTEGGDSGQGE
ncbi:MAG: HU family DNA-binding protein [Bacteroidales bacterium]